LMARDQTNDLQYAVNSLRWMGANAVAPLIAELTNNKPSVRSGVALTLVHLNTDTREAVPALIRTLSDSDADVRGIAAGALGKIGKEPDLVVPALMRALHDQSVVLLPLYKKRGPVCFFAAEALGNFGREGRAASPALLNVVRQGRPDEAEAASMALKKIDPNTAMEAGIK
jgi:HEAT repeat protein